MTNREVIKTSLSIYLPSLFVQLGAAMSLAFNPLWSQELGADVAMIGLIAAGSGIGHLLFDLPGGWITGRIREKPLLFISLAGITGCGFARSQAREPWQLLVIAIIMGMFVSVWGIARVAYIRRHVPSNMRGRTMAFLGGIMRVSRIAMPAIGGLVVETLGYRSMYGIQAGFFTLAALALIILMPPGTVPPGSSRQSFRLLRETFNRDGKSIAAAMIGITGLMLLRMSRNLIVPLWADRIGVGELALGGITSAGGIIETLMVVPAGIILDRAGRKWAAVPATLGFAISIAMLPLAGGPVLLALVYVLMSLSNGIGSGINMTISSDLAPRNAAGEFLGIWRFVTDSSMLAGPLLAGYIASAFALWAAPLAAGGIGVAAGLVILVGMKETKTPGNQEDPDTTSGRQN